MQAEAWGALGHRLGRVEPVAEDGVAERAEVEAQLVGAPGGGAKLEERAVLEAAEHRPAGVGHLAALRVDAVAARGVGVGTEGEVDLAGVVGGEAGDEGMVDLLDLPLAELALELPLGGATQREEQEARGVEVEAVHVESAGVERADAAERTVLEAGAAAGEREQARGLVDREHVAVLVHDVQRPGGGLVPVGRLAHPVHPEKAG